MRKFKSRKANQRYLPLSRQNLEDFIEAEQKRSIVFLKFQSVFLLSLAASVFLLTTFILILYFYNATIAFSIRSWVQVRSLTPVVTVPSRVSGQLDQVFVSQGQLVQKGALLGAIQTVSIKLDYEETRRSFVDKTIELHCLASLQSHTSVFKLPYDAQILVDQMMEQYDGTYKIEKCERELLRNVIADQALEEMIAALEDQSILLKNIVKIRNEMNTVITVGTINPFGLDDDFEFSFGDDQEALKQVYRDQYFPMLQYAQVQQKLQEVRKDYFLRKLQKEEDLDVAIEQTTQEMRYLDTQLKKLNEKLEDNFIYASITGKVVGPEASRAGVYFKENEAVFMLQPIENKFQVSVILNEQNSHKFTIGTPTLVSLENKQDEVGKLHATTVTILRRSDGKLEAILDLEGSSKRNSEIILATGYSGEGSQRFPASITIGKSKNWDVISNIIFNKFTKTPI